MGPLPPLPRLRPFTAPPPRVRQPPGCLPARVGRGGHTSAPPSPTRRRREPRTPAAGDRRRAHRRAAAGRRHRQRLGARKRYPGRLIATGRYGREEALRAGESGSVDAVGFGRDFIANPDLPERLARDAEPREALRPAFFGGDDRGYPEVPLPRCPAPSVRTARGTAGAGARPGAELRGAAGHMAPGLDPAAPRGRPGLNRPGPTRPGLTRAAVAPGRGARGGVPSGRMPAGADCTTEVPRNRVETSRRARALLPVRLGQALPRPSARGLHSSG
ncbi:hypothetical protein GTY85_27505 [Streptomyces sp. SID8377]|nr:hypothetical protein [Streptomyces sp. SID8377]